MDARHKERLGRVLEVMEQESIEHLWIEPSVDFFYVTGIETISMERVTGLLVAASGELRLVVPLLLAEEFEDLGARADIVTWDDAEGPRHAVSHTLRDVNRLHVQGSLPMWAYTALRQARTGLEVGLDAGSVARLRQRKDAVEVESLRRSSRVADDVMAWVARQDLAGLSERRLAGRIKSRYLELGQTPAEWTLVASGANSAIPHHSGADVPIDATAPLLTDFGGRVDGYWSDTTRVHFPTEVEDDLRHAWEVVGAAYDAAFSAVAEGVACRAVDGAARGVMEEAGYGDRFIHRTGHGIGLDVHEPPFITGSDEQLLETGHVFTIEPGVYFPGRWGLRYENVVHLGPDGPETLNESPKVHVLS